MKWKDLSLKERKQIYDSVRANNPDATYFDIKEQFDSIPEYEDGKAGYTPEERAWVARRTVELGMEGKPAPQDSLYTIVDRAKVQNKPKKYDPTDSAIEQGKQVLSGLNKTVGTALTGASLATMGLWNAARLLNVGTGSSWRLWAAKNALTGANAGLAADVGSFIEDPSITNAVQVGLSKVGSKDLTTTSNKIVNTISSGFDFDDLTKVPAYQDGKGKTINKADLPPEYRTGTPEYFERQRKISGAVNTVQPEAYITPAGYIKDAVNFIEDLGKGDYAGAAVDAALNLIPWGVGKTIKKIKKKVGRAIEGTDAYTAESYAEPFTPTITKKKKGKKVKTEADYDQEFAEVKRKYNNMQEYDKELSKITNDLFMPTDGSVETLEKVDKAYGTNYKKAASAIAFQDMANRGKYVKHQQMYDSAGNPIYGRTTGKVDQPTIEDMTISLNPDYYLEGTANHEISHLADALVNRVHNADATNNYMEYLLDRDNIMSYNEIRQSLMDVNPNTYRYLTTPSENKAHMIQLKRGMQKEGLINNWTDPITQDKIEEYLSYRSKYANRVNPVLRTLYDIRPDKQGFVNRMNNLTPIEWAVPLGLPIFFGEEQENK